MAFELISQTEESYEIYQYAIMLFSLKITFYILKYFSFSSSNNSFPKYMALEILKSLDGH
jgi:hypothetical protein